jgi:hypothetical protein
MTLTNTDRCELLVGLGLPQDEQEIVLKTREESSGRKVIPNSGLVAPHVASVKMAQTNSIESLSTESTGG